MYVCVCVLGTYLSKQEGFLILLATTDNLLLFLAIRKKIIYLQYISVKSARRERQFGQFKADIQLRKIQTQNLGCFQLT